VAVEDDVARVRLGQPEQRDDQRALAAAGSAHDAHLLRAAHRERDALRATP